MSVPQLAMSRLGLEACHYIFLAAVKRRNGWHILVLLRVSCRFVLSVMVGLLFDLSRYSIKSINNVLLFLISIRIPVLPVKNRLIESVSSSYAGAEPSY